MIHIVCFAKSSTRIIRAECRFHLGHWMAEDSRSDVLKQMIMSYSPGSNPIGMEQQVMQSAVVKLETTDLIVLQPGWIAPFMAPIRAICGTYPRHSWHLFGWYFTTYPRHLWHLSAPFVAPIAPFMAPIAPFMTPIASLWYPAKPHKHWGFRTSKILP